jgi:hypothetical protein
MAEWLARLHHAGAQRNAQSVLESGAACRSCRGRRWISHCYAMDLHSLLDWCRSSLCVYLRLSRLRSPMRISDKASYWLKAPCTPASTCLTNRIDEQYNTRTRAPMIGNRVCAFALSTAFAIICSTPPAIAALFDGNWSMVAVTTSGHCGRIPIGLGISRGRIYSTGGSFAFHRIQLGGRVSASGQVRMNAVAGPRIAHGTGRFARFRTVVRS